MQTIRKAIFCSALLFSAAPIYAFDSGLVAQLQQDGVQVEATDNLTLVIPVDTLFRFPSNTRLVDTSQSNVLYKAAQLIRSYGNRLVTISGHTDNVGSDEMKFQRSREQAETVAAYFWAQGIPLRNIIVIGCGDTEPVSSNLTVAGSAANRRIEIEIQ